MGDSLQSLLTICEAVDLDLRNLLQQPVESRVVGFATLSLSSAIASPTPTPLRRRHRSRSNPCRQREAFVVAFFFVNEQLFPVPETIPDDDAVCEDGGA